MRLVRLVVAGIVLGAVGGFVAALLRPRTVHRNLVADSTAYDPGPLPEQPADQSLPELPSPAQAHR